MTLSARGKVRANVIDGMGERELRAFAARVEDAIDGGSNYLDEDTLDEWVTEIIEARDESLSPLGRDGDGS